MNRAPAVVSRIEKLGGYLALDGEGSIRYRVPKDNPESQELLEAVKAEKQALLAYLQNRQAAQVVPAMPPGVRLIAWNLKDPPVAIETCTVVFGPALFARTTLEQLRVVLAEPTRWVGWTVPQLVDRLAQVGVVVALEACESPVAGEREQ